MSIQSLLQGLQEANVAFVVVGGVAAVAHGAPFQTGDVDVCYETADANVERLVGLLKRWDAYPRGWEPGLPFTIDTLLFKTTPILTLRTSEGWLDLLDRVDGVGSYSDVAAASIEITALDLRFRVIGLRALIAAKRATGRSRDLQQLPTLEAMLELRQDPRGNEPSDNAT